MIELLAAIPSIIYGIWGLFVFAPFVQQYIQPAMIDTLGRDSRDRRSVCRPAARHRRADRRLHPGDHGAAVHLVDHARRVRDGAADAEGKRLRARRHHAARSSGGSSCRSPASASSAASCSGSAGRSARRWPSPLSSAMRIASAPRSCSRERRSRPRWRTNSPRRSGDLYLSSLIALGFILFVITFIVLAIAKLLLLRLQKQAGS